MASVRQPGFASGEISPRLWGRTDLPRYATGAKRLYNFFVSKEGAAVSRPGAQYIAAGSSTLVDVGSGPGHLGPFVYAGAGVKLVPFQYSDTSTTSNAVLIFGEQSCQVLQGGSIVATVSGTVPYAAADLKKLRWAQSGDVLYLACAGYPPATITRTNSTTWAYAALSFARTGPTSPAVIPSLHETTVGVPDSNHPAKAWGWVVTEIRKTAQGLVYETGPATISRGWIWDGEAWNSNVEYNQRSTVSRPLIQYNGLYYYLNAGTVARGVAPGAGPGAVWVLATSYVGGNTYNAGDWVLDGSGVPYRSEQDLNTGHLLSDPAWWTKMGTTFQADAPGDSGTTWLYNSAGEFVVPIYADMGVELWAWPQGANDSQFLYYRWYRGRNGTYGWVGDSSGQLFYDTGVDPDFTQTPPEGSNPFVTNGVTENPYSVTFFEDRLVFAGTPTRPAFVFASATGDYLNFDQRLIPTDDDAIVISLAARKRELARSLVGADRLFVFTDASVWAVDGSGGSPLSPTSIEARNQVEVGIDWPEPLRVAGALLWVRNKGTGVRRVAYDFESAKLQSQDLSISAEHLVLGHTVADWCYVEDPWSVVWVARDDGVLLSLTYAPDDGLWAWGQHQVQGPVAGTTAVVQSVCSIVEGDEDVLYLAIQGLPLATTTAAWSNATTYNTGDAVLYNGNVFASGINGNVGNTPPSTQVSSANWHYVESTNGPSWILRLSTRQETVGKAPSCLDLYYTADSIPSGTVFFNLGWLASRAVTLVSGTKQSDGTYALAKFGTGTVGSNGVLGVAFSSPVDKIFIGIPYNCELESLPLPAARDRQKTVSQLSLELDTQATSIQAGPSLAAADLTTFGGDLRGTLAAQDVVKMKVSGQWKTTGQVSMRVTDPLPVTVLAISREVDAGAS